jgi:hypothetical protein
VKICIQWRQWRRERDKKCNQGDHVEDKKDDQKDDDANQKHVKRPKRDARFESSYTTRKGSNDEEAGGGTIHGHAEKSCCLHLQSVLEGLRLPPRVTRNINAWKTKEIVL